MGKLIYNIRNISVGYNMPLISGFSAEVDQGELVLVVGRNGAGKSTLLKSLKATKELLKGSVLLSEKLIRNYSNSELSRKVAIVNTSRPALVGWTVKDVLESTANSVNDSESMDILEEAIELCGIRDIVQRNADLLSDGEFQKVMIARAICQQTSVIILDEPTSFLDVVYRQHVLEIFNQLRDKFNTTLILSSHNFEPLLNAASQVWVISDKEIRVLREDLSYRNIVNRLK